ncbi:hypothetical protein PTI98_007469 [Pleurotus ostreatus]|nr:hypothetical protein PTI98_007469 [Pleurotus ostreatus]
MKRTTSESEHREKSAHSSSSDLVNQEATSQSQETQAPKKLRMLKKVFAAFRGKKLAPAESTPNEPAQGTVGDAISVKDNGTLSVPSAVLSFTGNRLDQQAEIHSRSKDDSDDDNASFFSAKSSGDDDFYANTSLPPFAEPAGANQAPRPEASLSLTNVGTIAGHRGAAQMRLLTSASTSVTSFHLSLSGVPDDPDSGREVPIENGNMEEMIYDSSSTPSSPGRMLASPQSTRELDTIQVVSSPVAKVNPAITGDENLVKPLDEGKGKVQSATLEEGNQESFLFQRTLDNKIIEINIDEQAVSKDRPLGDVGLPHFPVTGEASNVEQMREQENRAVPTSPLVPKDERARPEASDKEAWVRTEVEIVQESTYCEIQDTNVNTRDAGRDIAVVAKPSPLEALPPDLIPLPHDEGDLTKASETPAHRVVPEQTIRVAESQTASIVRALSVGMEPAPAPLREDLPLSSANATQELSSSLLLEKHVDLVPDPRTTDQDINAVRLLANLGGGESLPPRPPNEPSNATTCEARAQQPPHGTSLVQKGNHTAGPAAHVQESADVGVEMMLQQFIQMAERITSQSGDSERSPPPQAKPVNFVINVTNNHISSVAHGAGGDNYYGPIGQSAIGGQAGHNDIRNHQTTEISELRGITA